MVARGESSVITVVIGSAKCVAECALRTGRSGHRTDPTGLARNNVGLPLPVRSQVTAVDDQFGTTGIRQPITPGLSVRSELGRSAGAVPRSRGAKPAVRRPCSDLAAPAQRADPAVNTPADTTSTTTASERPGTARKTLHRVSVPHEGSPEVFTDHVKAAIAVSIGIPGRFR